MTDMTLAEPVGVSVGIWQFGEQALSGCALSNTSGVPERDPHRALAARERRSEAGHNQFSAGHQHLLALFPRVVNAQQHVVDRLSAAVLDTGRRPHVGGIIPENALLYPNEDTAGLGAAALLNIPPGLFLEQQHLY